MSTATDNRHARVEAYVASVTARTAQLWAKVDPNAISSSWYSLAIDAYAYVSIGQMAAAAGAEGYIAEVVPEAVALGSVQPRAYGGAASDGRNLLSLLRQPAITTLRAITVGRTPERALEMGGNSLKAISGTMVTDAARAAEHTAIAARPAVVGYVRTLHPPSCSRCAIIAGAFYRWNQGFLRHPRCDCTHEPVMREPTGRPTAPREYFDSLAPKMQDRYFGKETADLIRTDKVDMIRYVSEKVRIRKTMVKATADIVDPNPFKVIDRSAFKSMQDLYRKASLEALAGDAALAEELRIEARAFASRAYAGRDAITRTMPEQLTDGATRADAIARLTQYGYLN